MKAIFDWAYTIGFVLLTMIGYGFGVEGAQNIVRFTTLYFFLPSFILAMIWVSTEQGRKEAAEKPASTSSVPKPLRRSCVLSVLIMLVWFGAFGVAAAYMVSWGCAFVISCVTEEEREKLRKADATA